MTELKPCPFCGGKADGPESVEYGDNGTYPFLVPTGGDEIWTK